MYLVGIAREWMANLTNDGRLDFSLLCVALPDTRTFSEQELSESFLSSLQQSYFRDR